jgi:hypothetical protein
MTANPASILTSSLDHTGRVTGASPPADPTLQRLPRSLLTPPRVTLALSLSHRRCRGST